MRTMPPTGDGSRATSRSRRKAATILAWRSCALCLNALLGIWQFQGIPLFRSGLPYTVAMSRGVANTGVGAQRPNRIASGKLDDPTLEK